jgi:tRNA A-37 threonylcarbamoyl transferase component Bud32/TolB-like protein
LSHFSLGHVHESEAAGIEAHLAGCPDCVETLHGLQGDDTLVDAMRAQPDLKARPEIGKVVTELMVVLKGWQPSVSTQADKTAAAKEIAGPIHFLAPPEHPDELGRLGSYRILKILGAGGMGVVFEAEDTQLRRLVALKALRPHLAANSIARKRFLREGRAVAAMTHDNVVTIYQVGEERGIPFLAMQYLAGETLEARLRRDGALPLADIVRIGRELALGLSAAHAQGLLHRDVKPANIWLEARPGDKETTISGRVKLLDFGLAWVADDDPLTDHGTVVGTPSYMAPEQAHGEPADVRADLFSLGSVLYAMCTGHAPFQAASNLATLEKVRTENPKPIAESNPAIPIELTDLVEKLQAKNPADRCKSAVEVASLLQGSQAAEIPRQHAASRARGWWAAAALLFLPIVGFTLCEATAVTHLRDMVASLRAQPDVPKAPPQNPAVPPPPENGAEVMPIQRETKQVEIAPEKPGPALYPAAIFAFEERGAGVRDFGAKVTDILFAKLAVRPEIYLVDRSDLKKILGELELNISGVVKPTEANKIGQMTGAKILISGSVIQVDKRIYLVAKIVGTETSRVLAASVDGKSADELAPLVEKLAEQVAEVITKKGDQLVAKTVTKTDRIAALKTKLKGDRPVLWIKIAERHIGAPKIDPAAETEVGRYAKETGFSLIDPEEGLRAKADILIVGEAFSETAARHGNLISVKARVELKAIDRKTDKIIAVDRQTALVVDLTENIAGKAAIEEAAAILAERILPKLVK